MDQDNSFNLLTALATNVSNNSSLKEKFITWKKVFQFNPHDEEPFFLEIKDGDISVIKGTHDEPTATLISGNQDMVDMLNGKLDAFNAYFSGKLKITGNLMETQSLNSILKDSLKNKP